jgi:hypothetical protein
MNFSRSPSPLLLRESRRWQADGGAPYYDAYETSDGHYVSVGASTGMQMAAHRSPFCLPKQACLAPLVCTTLPCGMPQVTNS